MEKHFITALLVLVLLAPQLGLEAKSSRYNEVKERDYDAEERDHEYKNRYHKSKKRHHKSKKRHNGVRKFYRFAHTTKAELELLKQAISEMDAKMKALEPQAQLPADLEARLDALRMTVDDNSSDVSLALTDILDMLMDIDKIDINTGQIDDLEMAVAGLVTRLDALEPIVEDHESRIFALENPALVGVSFSGDFIQRISEEILGIPDGITKGAWSKFTEEATGSFSSIEIKNNLGGSVKCSNTPRSTEIAGLLHNFFPDDPTVSVICAGFSWNIGHFGDGVALSVSAGPSSAVNDCEPNATVRPLVNHANWGGIGITCSAPTQTLEVILTR